MEKLSPQEEEVMLCIWSQGPCYVKDIVARYPDPKPPYTTLASVVKNLERKKYLKCKQHGNIYLYTPLVEKNEYGRSFMGKVVCRYFENSYKEMVSFFAREQKISAAELEEIIRMIEEGKK